MGRKPRKVEEQPRRRVAPEVAEQELLDVVRQGRTIEQGLKVIRRSRSWYETRRRESKGFADRMDSVRLGRVDASRVALSLIHI